MKTVAVVGAGLAGLACAARLARHQDSVRVRIFDKGRGPGGRMSTRRAPGDLHFDHGAQFFTARDQSFEALVKAWVRMKLAAPWEARFVSIESGRSRPVKDDTVRYVGTPGMNAFIRHLATELAVAFQTRITSVERRHDRWWCLTETGMEDGPFDALVCAAPAPQSAELLTGVPELQAEAESVVYAPCWAAMAAFAEPSAIAFDAAKISGTSLSWAARDTSKPGRTENGPECWVLHAGPEWSREHLEESAETVAPALLQTFTWLAGTPESARIHLSAHRWRYALVERPVGRPFLFDPGLMIGACGDWCIGGRVEAAWLSGNALGDAVADAF